MTPTAGSSLECVVGPDCRRLPLRWRWSGPRAASIHPVTLTFARSSGAFQSRAKLFSRQKLAPTAANVPTWAARGAEGVCVCFCLASPPA
eukprot:scaffold28581_cov94-Isochrysis_galbana.AAC.3